MNNSENLRCDYCNEIQQCIVEDGEAKCRECMYQLVDQKFEEPSEEVKEHSFLDYLKF